MNDLTPIRPEPPYSGSLEQSKLATELAKALALVAPITMTGEQQTAWLASAVDALQGIRGSEAEAVSLEVRRSVTRPSQIVPEIARLVAAKRAERSRIDRMAGPSQALPPPKRHIADRERDDFTAEDWAELNLYLDQMGSRVRYRSDGSRYSIT